MADLRLSAHAEWGPREIDQPAPQFCGVQRNASALYPVAVGLKFGENGIESPAQGQYFYLRDRRYLK